MKNKNLLRLIIFVLLAYGITGIPALIMNHAIGFEEYFTTSHYSLFNLPIMYGPALANILTRLITKEGFHDMKLHLRLKGNVKYYLMAFLLIPALMALGSVLLTTVYGKWDFSQLSALGSPKMLAGIVLFGLGSAPLMAFNTFGEEFGWRGYMNDKLKPLCGTAGTVVIGGVIWGLWHAPLTVAGHNFGTEYRGYPYTGFLYMAVLCTVIGVLLMYVTEKTGSIYPAAIMHASLNFGAPYVQLLVTQGLPESFSQPGIPKERLLENVPMVLCAAVFMVLLLMMKRSQKNAK